MVTLDEINGELLPLTCSSNVASQPPGGINLRRIDWTTHRPKEQMKTNDRSVKFESNASPFFPGKYPDSIRRPIASKTPSKNPFLNSQAYSKMESPLPTHQIKGKAKAAKQQSEDETETPSFTDESDADSFEQPDIDDQASIALALRLQELEFNRDAGNRSDDGMVTPRASTSGFRQLPTPAATPGPSSSRVTPPPSSTRATPAPTSAHSSGATPAVTGVRAQWTPAAQIPALSISRPDHGTSSALPTQGYHGHAHDHPNLPSNSARWQSPSVPPPNPQPNFDTIYQVAHRQPSTLAPTTFPPPNPLVPPTLDIHTRIVSVINVYPYQKMQPLAPYDPEWRAFTQTLQQFAVNNLTNFDEAVKPFLLSYFLPEVIDELLRGIKSIFEIGNTRSQSTVTRRRSSQPQQVHEVTASVRFSDLQESSSSSSTDGDGDHETEQKKNTAAVQYRQRKAPRADFYTKFYWSESKDTIRRPPAVSKLPKSENIACGCVYVHKSTKTKACSYWLYDRVQSGSRRSSTRPPELDWIRIYPLDEAIEYPGLNKPEDEKPRYLHIWDDGQPSWNRGKPKL
ncbi:hypothetical protein BDN72DRAFT_862067 [Pluteus cervinus]|uniref:Uncharacterized protein n=1 Tax=Pluteus cervinus TaxID=181527 RepID=A0ACD3ADG8_9AGAR|nr:hypothetical protein BDN72DRAFT_862067 [Pluteus cervinus]